MALLAPTTLLAQQHFQTFTDRFKGLPIRIAQMSRLVSQKNINATKDEIRNRKWDTSIAVVQSKILPWVGSLDQALFEL